MIPRRQAINVPASICCILHANRDMGEVPSESARSPAVTCPDSEACSTTRLSARVACHERCRGRAIKRGAFAALSANTDRLLCLAAILPFELCLEKALPALTIPTSTHHHQHHHHQALRVQLICARASFPTSTVAPTHIRYTHHTLSSPTRHSSPNAAIFPYLPPQHQQHHALIHHNHGPSLAGLLFGLCCPPHPVRTEL